ncbi:uncharacterized protein LODBEIA_P46400 [Lodderomyces beijingensis]|uniref:HECT-type E3 ubiquitin transferase n=1 Tax=Lodderomyces beijingensis TaxID=1775926 RepID=A0ABP0ZTG9_9ASCO
MEMTQPVQNLLKDLTSASESEFPEKLMANLVWNRARGDLIHWIPVLNRIDEILAKYIMEHDLEDEYPKLRLIPAREVYVITACLSFTKTLLKNCADHSIYSSAERIYALINTPTVDVRLKALEVAVLLGERLTYNTTPKLSPSKATKTKVLQLAKSYPPLVPSDCEERRVEEERSKDTNDRVSIVGDHYNFVDTLNPHKAIPKKWKSINFQYYKSALSYQKDTESSPQKPQDAKFDKVVVEGMQTFAIPEESVAKMSLEQVFARGSESIPKSSWFDFAIAAEIAKSFNDQSRDAFELRNKLTQIKCYATAFSCSVLTNQATSSELLEAEPYIFSFLVDAVSPENKAIVPEGVFAAAMKTLDCISMKKAWGGDIIRCMGGNVSHGVLFQCLRQIRELVTTDQASYNEDAHMPFFSMLSNMIKTKNLLPWLSSGGLLAELTQFLGIDSRYKWTCSAVAHLLALYLSYSPESLDSFISNNGFPLLIESIRREVALHISRPQYDMARLGECPQYSTIPIRHVNYLKNLMKLVADLLNSDHGDRLRNLFDSPILDSFNKIVTHPSMFGPQILASTIDSVFYIIHNEPTAFSILNEASVIDTILDNYESLFLPSSQLIMSLAEVLGAISLNNAGLKKVIDKQSIPIFYKSFYNLKIAKVLVESDDATNLGCSFDELGRHYSSLKPIILQQTIELVEKMPAYVDCLIQGVQLYTSPEGSLYTGKDDPTPIEQSEQQPDAKPIESRTNVEYTFMLDALYFFLGGLFQDSGQWGPDAMQKIEFKSWIKALASKNAPFDYFLSNGFSSLLGILKYFDEDDPEYGLPVIIEELVASLSGELVSKYINFQGEASFFTQIDAQQATVLLQELSKINVLLFALTEIYINLGLVNDRIRQILEYYGQNEKLAEMLCKFLSRSIVEETVIRMNTPDKVLTLTSTFPNDSPPLQVHVAEPSKKEKDFPPAGTSAKFKNTLQLRMLNYYYQSCIPLILAATVRACIPRRHDHQIAQSRRAGIEILLWVAQGINAAFGQKFHNQYIQQSYLLGMSNVVSYILSQKERGKDIVYLPFAIALLQFGFYKKVNEAAVSLWDALLTMDPHDVETTSNLKYISAAPSSIVRNALNQMFIIYARVVNSDTLASISHIRSYFHSGYSSNVESELLSSFLIQVRGDALDLLVKLISPHSKIFASGKESASISVKNIPTSLVDQLIKIAGEIFSGKKEIENTDFVPFDPKLTCPPEDQMAYLISLGMSESQADHYFDHHKNVSELGKGIPMSCPIFSDIKAADWKNFADELKSDDVDFSVNLPRFKKAAEIVSARKEVWSIGMWVDIAEKFPAATAAVADLFATVRESQVFEYLADRIQPDLAKSKLSLYLHLVSLIFRDGIIDHAFSEKLDKLFGPGSITDESVNEAYFPYLVSIFEQKVVFEGVHSADSLSKGGTGEDTTKIVTDMEHVKIGVFDQIQRLTDVSNGKSANSLARVLALYTKHPDYARRVSELPILSSLMKFIGDESGDKSAIESMRTSMALIFRGSFETREVITRYMSHEIEVSLGSRGFKQSKNLRAMLKDNLSLVFREPEILTNVVANQTIIENYDGIRPLQGEIKITKAKAPSTDPPADIEMTDSAATNASSNPNPNSANPNANPNTATHSGAIINLLMSELMEVSKKDWVSDPENAETKEEEEEKKPEVDFFANRNFTHVCFLLQTIAELLGSYKQAKFDFLTFSRKNHGEIKLRTTSLNFFLHQLIPTHPFESSGSESERRRAVSSLAKIALMSLVSSPILDVGKEPNPRKEDPDLALIRRFAADLLIKVMRDTSALNSLAKIRYGKLFDLFDLTGSLISSKYRESLGPLLDKESTKQDTFYLTKVYTEKEVPNVLTSLVSEFDLNYPEIEKVVKAALKSITSMGKNKVDFEQLFTEEGQADADEDDIVPDDENEERDETPDLFRNSTLGMYDLEVDSEDDFYDEEGALEVVMSDEEIDSEDASDLSAIDSGDEDEDDDGEDEEDDDGEGGDIEMHDHVHVHRHGHGHGHGHHHDHDNESYSEGSEGSLDDIEIIDELDLDSASDHEEFYSDGDDDVVADIAVDDDDDGGDGDGDDPDGYSEEEDSSDYDEDELDGWIEQLEGDEPLNNDEGPEHRPTSSHLRRSGAGEHSDDEEDSEGDFSDMESRSGFELRMVTPDNGLRRIFNQAAFTNLDRHANSALSMLVDGLFRERNFRGSIEIQNEDGRNAPTSLGRLFENMMHIGHASGKQSDHSHSFHVKSTIERWADALAMFNPPEKDLMVEKLVPAIVSRVEDKSVEAYNAKREEIEKIRKEREEKRMKEMEEERKRLEEEAKQREENAANAPSREPVFVRIGDRDVDISGTDIDRDYIEALPEDMREEVLASYVRERRANASTSTSDSREIDPDFLNALPGNIRDEILQQESFARRYAALEEAREDFEDAVDNADERESSTTGDRQSRRPSMVAEKQQPRKSGKIFFTPLVDKQGIASIVRLLFSTLSIPQREQIYQALHYMCHSKESRVEIIDLILSVLHDGFTTSRSLQRVYSQVHSRAGGKDVKVKTPVNTTPISVGIQLIEAVDYLLERSGHLRYFLVAEHENQFLVKKGAKKPPKEHRFQINYLLKLLENKLLAEDQTFSDILARVLQVSTRPLAGFKNLSGGSAPPFPAPYVPDENFRLIVKILTANDCSNTTFRRTISTMQNFSVLENAQKLFTIELSEQAADYGRKIIADLNKLTNELVSDGKSSAKSFSSFSAHSSDQAKLLRVLTALDYMYENKEKEQVSDGEIEELTNLYRKLSLGTLWDALSDCLRILEKKPELTNIANALLPLIESLMVVCKHGKVSDQVRDTSKYEVKKVDFTKEPIESLFFSFTDEHKKILNQMVRGNPNLMSGPFGMLVKNPRVLEFDNKKSYFDRKLHTDKKERTKMSIDVRRDQVFLDSYRSLFFKSKDEFKNSKLEITFKGELGIDAGGVTREWYQVLSRQMFNPDYALFTPVVSDESTFHPNRTSYINPEHLSFFKFIGRIIGKAIFDNCYLDCHFSRAVYKRILGQPQSLKDMETLDLEYYKSLLWMLENDITDVITETFSVETDDYGEHKIIDLIENGKDIPVTEENKQDYVKKVVEYKLQTSVEEQMENFLIGFHEIIPKNLVAIFDEKELELLISGLPDIDVNDWQTHTRYNNYSPSSEQIQWFWRAVKSFDKEEKARLIQFATGTSKIPLAGWKEVKFNIHRDYGSTDRLPSSHTCFNQIDLPTYTDYETLRGSLLMAITEGHEGFGLA